MLRVAVIGAAGRMGRNLISAVLEDENTELAGAFVRNGSPLLGKDVGSVLGHQNVNVNFMSGPLSINNNFDIMIDFSSPESSLANLRDCADLGKPIVIGTTGFDNDGLKEIKDKSAKIPVILSYNTSLGINMLLGLLSMGAKALGNQGYDIEVIEYHHRHKVDAPSGTAIMIGEELAMSMDTTLSDVAVYQRVGDVGPRTANEIGFSVVRSGDIVGEHTVMFATEGERLELTHKATSRMTFARGAVKAACWLCKKEAGLYDMRDVLALR